METPEFPKSGDFIEVFHKKLWLTILTLTYFRPMFPFYTPWKRQKTFGFLTFSGGIEREYWPEMV